MNLIQILAASYHQGFLYPFNIYCYKGFISCNRMLAPMLNNLRHKNALLTKQETNILQGILASNILSQYLNLNENDLQNITQSIQLIEVNSQCDIIAVKNTIYLLLEGHLCEYLERSVPFPFNNRVKEKCLRTVIRSIGSNDYFVHFRGDPQKLEKIQHKFIAKERCLVARITKKTFNHFLVDRLKNKFNHAIDYLKKVPRFNKLPKPVLYEVSKYFRELSIKSGTIILNKESKTPNIFFILNGEIQYSEYKPGQRTPKQRTLHQYDIFGLNFDHETLQRIEASYEAIATADCLLYTLDKKVLAIITSQFGQYKQPVYKYSSVNLNEQIIRNDFNHVFRSQDKQKVFKNNQRKMREIQLQNYLSLNQQKKRASESMTRKQPAYQITKTVFMQKPQQKQGQFLNYLRQKQPEEKQTKLCNILLPLSNPEQSDEMNWASKKLNQLNMLIQQQQTKKRVVSPIKKKGQTIRNQVSRHLTNPLTRKTGNFLNSHRKTSSMKVDKEIRPMLPQEFKTIQRVSTSFQIRKKIQHCINKVEKRPVSDKGTAKRNNIYMILDDG